MTAQPPASRFPALRVALALTVAAVVAVPLAEGLVSLVLGSDQARQAALWMTGMVYVMSLLSLWPVVLAAPLGVTACVWGYFIGSGGRFVACLLGWLLISRLVGLPRDTAGLAMVTAYLLLMFVEVGFFARYLWRRGQSAGASAGGSDAPFEVKEVLG